MTELIIQRALPVTAFALESGGDGWTLYGRAIPYNRVEEVTDNGVDSYWEGWKPEAFARDAAKGGRWVNLFVTHRGDEGERFLGRVIELSEADDGLYAAIRLERTHPKAEAARSGELTGWSVSAHIYRSRTELVGGREVVWRESAGLSHIAATPRPQYAGAGVIAYRDHELVGPRPTPKLDEARAILDKLRRRA